MAEKKKVKAKQSHISDGFDIEPLLQALGPGGLGLYQITQMALQLFQSFGVAFNILSVVFIGFQPSYRCARVNVSTLETMVGLGDNSTRQLDVVYEQCTIHVTANQSGSVQLYTLPCVEGYDYAGHKHTSFFTEWDLTCEKSGLTELTQTLMMVGQGVGAFVFTSLADRYGRKPTHVICTIGLLGVGIAMALSPNYVFLLFCRVVIGALQQGSGLLAYTMFIELLPKWLRGAAVLIDGTVWSCCVMLLPLLAYLMQDYSWRYLQLVLAAFSAYSIILPWFLDESLRWLVANGRKKGAERVLKKASRMNGVEYHKVHAALQTLFRHQTTDIAAASVQGHPINGGDSETSNEKTDRLLGEQEECSQSKSNNEDLGNNGPINEYFTKSEPINADFPYRGPIKKHFPNDGPITKDVANSGPINGDFENNGRSGDDELATKDDGIEVKKYTVLDILRHGVLRKTACIIWYLWITNSLIYYCLALTSSSLAGNRFVNFFLQAMMELPAYVTAFFALRRYGRRNVTCVFLCLATPALLLSSLLIATVSGSEIGLITNVLSLLGKFGISGSFGTLYIFCPELFPTNLRTAGLGMSSAVARVGGMVAPYSKILADIVLWGPGVITGGMSLVAAYVVLKLPETRGRPLPTTIEEMKAWHKKKPSDIRRREFIYKPTSNTSNNSATKQLECL